MAAPASDAAARRILIMGAAGRDFHVFNTAGYRETLTKGRVVAFTATQIPHINKRRYPTELAGTLYPQGIPIHPEEELESLVHTLKVTDVIFAYSDVPLSYVEKQRRRVTKTGASFRTFDVDASMIPSKKPVIAVCAVRTGCGKSQTCRKIVNLLRKNNLVTVVIRHPMPYGNLAKQAVQRFSTVDDLAKHHCTIEEMEEYEHHIVNGAIVYAGADYQAILNEAEKEADVILWDGGNNDTPFYKPDLWIAVADAHRPGHELSYFPGKINFERAHMIIINKCDTAKSEADISHIEQNAKLFNPNAQVVRASSPVTVSRPTLIRGKKVLAVEDGPTLTHGGMKIGAATVAANKWGAAELVDPRPWLKGELKETFEKYPGIGALLPAMGYGDQQVRDLEATIDAVECDLVLIGTPIDLGRVVKINKPQLRVTYALEEEGSSFRAAVLGVSPTWRKTHKQAATRSKL